MVIATIEEITLEWAIVPLVGSVRIVRCCYYPARMCRSKVIGLSVCLFSLSPRKSPDLDI